MSTKPPTPPIMQFFAWGHLPPHLQEISARYGVLAQVMLDELPDNPERAKALDLLLAAKDAAVRAKLYKG
jgi:hypothetical protein